MAETEGANIEEDGGRVLEPHLLRFLSHLGRRDDPGMGGVLSSSHELGLGQLLSAVLLHSLGLQLGDAGVLGPENLGRVMLCTQELPRDPWAAPLGASSSPSPAMTSKNAS